MALIKRGKKWSLVRTVNGKQVWSRLGTGDKMLAEIKAGEILKEAASVASGLPCKDVDFEVFRNRFLEERVHKAAGTWLIDRRALLNFETDTNVKKVVDVTPDLLLTVQRMWKSGPKERGLAVRNRDLRAIKCAMRTAELWYRLTPQRWDIVKLEREKPREDWYSADDMVKLLKHLTGSWRTAAMLGALAGLRPGEILHLPWSHVDFRSNQIKVDDYKAWHLKNPTSKRWVPLADELKPYLTELRKKHADEEYVLGDHVEERGADIPTDGSFSAYYARLVRKAGLSGTLYTLRHTFAAHLVSSGIDLYTVARLMGHSSTKTTLVYAHLSDQCKKDAIKRLPFGIGNGAYTSGQNGSSGLLT